MYKLVEWSPNIDLREFYKAAKNKGHLNNSSQKAMVDCFSNEKKFQVWVLYKDSKVIGSVAAHSMPELGENSYRILARTCVLDGVHSGKGLGTKRHYIQQHQNVTSQIFIPKMIDWCGLNSEMYATSNQLDSGSQKKVHQIYFPLLEKQGEVSRIKEMYYRGTEQTVWKLHPNTFYGNLSKFPRWV